MIELHFGNWQGHTIEEIVVQYPGQVKAPQADNRNFLPLGKNAESHAILALRFNGWLEGVTTNTVCITYGGCLRSLFHLVDGLTKEDASDMDIYQDKIIRPFDDVLERL